MFFTFLKTVLEKQDKNIKTGFSGTKRRTLTFKTAYMQKITEMRDAYNFVGFTVCKEVREHFR